MTSHPVLRHVQPLTASDVAALLGREHLARRAADYVQEGRVEEIWVDGTAVRAHVAGSRDAPYHCVIRLHEGELEAECSCPYKRGTCWHVGAVLLALIDDAELMKTLELQASRPGIGAATAPPERPTAAEEAPSGPTGPTLAPEDRRARRERIDGLRDRLLAFRKVDLCDALAHAAVDDADLESRVLSRVSDPANLDLKLFRQAARAALRPGRALTRWEAPRVAADLREVCASVGRLALGGQPELALDLLLEIAWLAWARLEEADDREGTLALATREILFDWIHRWAEQPSRDRSLLAREIHGWLMEDGGRGLAGLVLEGKEALGPVGLETLHALLAPVLEARVATRAATLFGEAEDAVRDPVVDCVRAALREVAEARGDLDAFLENCDPEGTHGAEIAAAASRLSQGGKAAEALRWLERGRRRASGSARAEIEDLRITLLARLDRRREAIDAAWEAFLAEPGEGSLARLIGVVAEPERHEWRRRALDHAEAASDASSFVELCIAAGDLDRLLSRLEHSPGFVLGAGPELIARAAAHAEETSPRAAARLHVHLASRWLADGDARHFERAREHLERARRACERAGLREEWEQIRERLAATHAVVRGWYRQP